MALAETIGVRITTALPRITTVAAICVCLYFGWKLIDTKRYSVPTASMQGVKPVGATSPSDIELAQSAAAAHIFGQMLQTPVGPAIEESIAYKVTGIACIGDAMHCADQQIAVATLSGPDGDTVVHVGSRLGAGTVSRIDPYLVVVTSASGVQNIKFDIPTASLDERIPTIASGDGDAKAAMVIRAKAPESEKALAQNMTALQAALEAAQVQRKSLEPPNKQKPLIKPTSTGSGPSH